MINEIQVKEIINKNIPELKIPQEQLKSLYKTIDTFASFTKELIRHGNLPLVRDCFMTAEYLMVEGSSGVKQAIENLYVFSVATFMDLTGAVSKQVKELMPDNFRKEYQKQVCSSYP